MAKTGGELDGGDFDQANVIAKTCSLLADRKLRKTDFHKLLGGTNWGSFSMLSRLLGGKQQVKLKHVAQFADALGCDPGILVQNDVMETYKKNVVASYTRGVVGWSKDMGLLSFEAGSKKLTEIPVDNLFVWPEFDIHRIPDGFEELYVSKSNQSDFDYVLDRQDWIISQLVRQLAADHKALQLSESTLQSDLFTGRRAQGVTPDDCVSGEQLMVAICEGRAKADHVILGDIGSGKTSFARKLSRYAAERHDLTPILIECRSISQMPSAVDIAEIAAAFAIENGLVDGGVVGVGQLKEMLSREIKSGRALVIIDGLDEIYEPEYRRVFVRALSKATSRTVSDFRSRIVLTSRLSAYESFAKHIDDFVIARLRRFDVAQTATFAARWYTYVMTDESDNPDGIGRLLNLFERFRHVGNPLLLTAVAAVFTWWRSPPENRVKLYEELTKILWAWKLTFRAGVGHQRSDERVEDQSVQLDDVEKILSYIALSMSGVGENQTRIHKDDVIRLFNEYHDEYNYMLSMPNLDAREFLNVIRHRSTVLSFVGRVPDANETSGETLAFEFSHASLQNFYAGKAMLAGTVPGVNTLQSAGDVAVRMLNDCPGFQRFGDACEVPEDVRSYFRLRKDVLRFCVKSAHTPQALEIVNRLLEIRDNSSDRLSERIVSTLVTYCLGEKPSLPPEVVSRVIDGFVACVSLDDHMAFRPTRTGHMLTLFQSTALEISQDATLCPVFFAALESAEIAKATKEAAKRLKVALERRLSVAQLLSLQV